MPNQREKLQQMESQMIILGIGLLLLGIIVLWKTFLLRPEMFFTKGLDLAEELRLCDCGSPDPVKQGHAKNCLVIWTTGEQHHRLTED